MKALTIWQPWASLIVYGFKPIEYRKWKLPSWMIGQRIVIHAGKLHPARLERNICDLAHASDADLVGTCGPTCNVPAVRYALRSMLGAVEKIPLGAGLGTATLGEPLQADEQYRRAGLQIEGQGPWNWAWSMLDVKAWDEPVPCRGFQGFWPWPG
jgi:hypothetical protein